VHINRIPNAIPLGELVIRRPDYFWTRDRRRPQKKKGGERIEREAEPVCGRGQMADDPEKPRRTAPSNQPSHCPRISAKL